MLSPVRNEVREVGVIIAPPTEAGMQAAAAAFREANSADLQLIFIENLAAIDSSKWPVGTRVGIIDHPASIDFVQKVHQQGHQILFIATTGQNSWQKVLSECHVTVRALWEDRVALAIHLSKDALPLLNHDFAKVATDCKKNYADLSTRVKSISLFHDYC